jgi:HEAT repeat protein
MPFGLTQLLPGAILYMDTEGHSLRKLRHNLHVIKVDGKSRIRLLYDMEKHFDVRDIDYFKKLLGHRDNVIRTRAVCILAEMGGRRVVRPICNTLKNDKDSLVRHEAAFALGQLGASSALFTLSQSLKTDPSIFVRHEAAIAVGVIGSETGRDTLLRALTDESEEVRESARIALTNLDYISSIKRKRKFAKLTGG